MKSQRIGFSPSAEMETAIQAFQAEVKAIGTDISRHKALVFFAELGRRHWYEQKQARTKASTK